MSTKKVTDLVQGDVMEVQRGAYEWVKDTDGGATEWLTVARIDKIMPSGGWRSPGQKPPPKPDPLLLVQFTNGRSITATNLEATVNVR